MSSYRSTESSSTRMCRRWRMRWSRSSPARRAATRSMRALTLPKSRMGLWSNTCAPYTDSEWKMVVTPCDTSSRSALVQRRGQVHDHAGARRGHVLHVVRVDVDEAGHHVRTGARPPRQHAHRGIGCASKSDAPTGSMAAMRPSMTTTSQSGSTRSAHTTVPPRMMQELVSMVQVPFKGSHVGVVSQRGFFRCPRLA